MQINFKTIIIGDFITLRKVEIEDAEIIFSWRSGISGRFLHHPEGYSAQKQKEWIKSRGNNEINYIIQDKITFENVGMISIYEVNSVDMVAEVGRLLLCDNYLNRSNPYGLEALLLCYSYVFNEMNFRKITGVVASINQNVVKLQLFLGMKQEGYLNKHTIIDDCLQDLHILSIFKEEFNVGYSRKIKMLLNAFRK